MTAKLITMTARLRAKEKQMVAKYGKDIFTPPPINRRLHFKMHGTYSARA
jgi:hypothetical protein